MTSFYTPKDPTVLDTIGYTSRVVDALLRANPLTNASVDSGLMRWIGNYQDEDGTGPIDFLWVGEFTPRDTNLPGDPKQKGFNLVRDDSRGGKMAMALYDHAPSSGDGLRQTLHFDSGDGNQLYRESRDGGQQWPRTQIPMYARDSDLALWPGTDSASFSAIYESQASVVGNYVRWRMWNATTGGAVGRFRMRVQDQSGVAADIISTPYDLAANTNGVEDSFLDISTMRGRDVTLYWEAARTNASGKARAVPITVSCYT